MENFTRTFRPKSTLDKLDSEEEVSNRPLKDSSLPFNIYFQDDEKIMSYYMATVMTGQFMGVSANKTYIKNPASSLSSEPAYVVDERDLKVVFNSLLTVTRYFKVRYSNKMDLVDRFIAARLPISYPVTIMSFVEYYMKTKSTYENIPRHLRVIMEDWEFLIKMINELMALERFAIFSNTDIFYQALHYYYYDTLMEPLKLVANEF